MTDEAKQQERLHEAIAECLADDIDGNLLTGWIIIYETEAMGRDSATCGHLYGPAGMKTWRALGLIEWARRFCLGPDPDEE